MAQSLLAWPAFTRSDKAMDPIIPVGIDLGTTLSAASFVDSSGRTQMIPNSAGEILTPSAVLFEDDGIQVGAAARQASEMNPERVAESIKHDMGAAAYRHKIMGQDYPPEVLQGCILRQLRHDIFDAIGPHFQAVITVPAYFDEARRKTTADAGTMSGLPVLDIVNEPTAAALAFGERLGYLSHEGAPRDTLRLVVYDLGGGTFDVTVIELSAGKVETLATDGDYELGGNNWDARLADFAEERYRELWPEAEQLDRKQHNRLVHAVRRAKHALTDSPLATLVYRDRERELNLPIRREEFEELTADLVERTLFTTKQALNAAGLEWSDIDRLLLVGGSTRMPAIRRAMHQISGLEPDDAVHPDEAVARGAAIFARYLLGQQGSDSTVPPLQVTDVSAHGIGIEGVNQGTGRAENVTVIPRNTPLPFEVMREFVTRTDNQRSVKLQLLEGDSSLLDQCSPLAVAAIKHLPPNLPAGTPITVRYSFQANGRLEVDAKVASMGDEAHIELQRVRGMADQRVETWKKVICQDGGYNDFEDALAALLLADDTPSSPAQVANTELPPEKPGPQKPGGPADTGAARAASRHLKDEFRRSHPSEKPPEGRK